MLDMVLHEGSDEIVAVVVSGLNPALQRNSGRLTGLLKEFGLQLLFKEGIRAPLIDQDRRRPTALGSQLARIPPLPSLSIWTEVV